jgi:hypothetical protein
MGSREGREHANCDTSGVDRAVFAEVDTETSLNQAAARWQACYTSNGRSLFPHGSAWLAAHDNLLDGWDLPFKTDIAFSGIMPGAARYRLIGEPDAIRRCIETKATVPVSDAAQARIIVADIETHHDVFSLKVPQVIAHEKLLADCESDVAAFLSAARLLGDKPLCCCLQFGYFNEKAFASLDAFLERLEPFLAAWPGDVRVAVEVRNKNWLNEQFAAHSSNENDTVSNR